MASPNKFSNSPVLLKNGPFVPAGVFVSWRRLLPSKLATKISILLSLFVPLFNKSASEVNAIVVPSLLRTGNALAFVTPLALVSWRVVGGVVDRSAVNTSNDPSAFWPTRSALEVNARAGIFT